MKKRLYALLLLVCSSVALCGVFAASERGGHHNRTRVRNAVKGSAGKDTPETFVTVPRLQEAVEKYQRDPLATYAVIMRASHQHLGPQAAVAYDKLLTLHPDDPYVQSAYAFSQFMAVGPFSESFLNGQPTDLIRKIRLDQLKAAYYRGQASKSAAKSSVIRFECALQAYYSAQANPTTSLQVERGVIDDLRQVTKDDPKWPDAHYWLAVILNLYAAAIYSQSGPSASQAQTVALGKEMVSELQQAEHLQPKLRGDCLMNYAYAYQWLQQPRQSLKFLDLSLQARPAQKQVLDRFRQYLLDEIKKQK